MRRLFVGGHFVFFTAAGRQIFHPLGQRPHGALEQVDALLLLVHRTILFMDVFFQKSQFDLQFRVGLVCAHKNHL